MNQAAARGVDVGDEKDIHPKKKEPAGVRLALLARKIGHGEQIVAMGPVYKAMKVEGNRIVLTFDNVGAGLEARDGPLTGFTICGNDQKFRSAKAEIVGDTGLLCDPTDVDGFAGALSSVLDDSRLAATLREKGRARAATFTWQATAEALARAIDEVLVEC